MVILKIPFIIHSLLGHSQNVGFVKTLTRWWQRMPLIPSTCEAETELSMSSKSITQVPEYQVYTENSVSEKQKQNQQTLFYHLWLSLTGKLGLEEYAVFYPPNGK